MSDPTVRLSDMTTTYSGRLPDLESERGKGWVIENAPLPHRKSNQDPFSAVVILNDGATIWPDYAMYNPFQARAWIRRQLGIKSENQAQAEKEDTAKWEALRLLIIQGPKGGKAPDWRNVARTVLYRLEDAEARIAELERKLAKS